MSFSGKLTQIRMTAGRFLWPLKPVWIALEFAFFAAIAVYAFLEITTSGMTFAGEDGEHYRSATQPQWFTLVSQNGLGYRAYRSSILTKDYRELQVDVILPQNLPQSLPLTITVEGGGVAVEDRDRDAFPGSDRAHGVFLESGNACGRLDQDLMCHFERPKDRIQVRKIALEVEDVTPQRGPAARTRAPPSHLSRDADVG